MEDHALVARIGGVCLPLAGLNDMERVVLVVYAQIGMVKLEERSPVERRLAAGATRAEQSDDCGSGMGPE